MLHREIYRGLAAVPGTAQQAIAAKANFAEALAAVQVRPSKPSSRRPSSMDLLCETC